jgi:hypothetical protein
MRKLFRFLCTLGLIGVVSTPSSAQTLTADELIMLMSGTSIETTNRGDWPFYITFNLDGSLEGRIDANRELLDDGKWWTKVPADGSAKFCHQFEEFAKRKKFCWSFTIEDDGRTIARYKRDGTRLKKDWAITKPGPQASLVTAARKAPRMAGRSRAVPQAQRRPPSRRPGMAPAPPAQQPLTAAQDTQPPVIDVPAAIAAKGAVAAISGRIRDTSRLIEVTIDGRPVAVGTDGSFSARRGVPQGTSTITIAALDEWGNRATRSVTLTRETLATRSPAPVKPPVKPEVTAKPRANPFADIHFGRYKALVIGNNNYRDMPKLKTAVNDARAVAKLLSDDYGFDTKLLIDATRADVIAAMARMRAKLKADDNLLIYYAGHGVVDNITEQGYWLPVDAEEAVPTNWVSNNDITTMLRAIRANHIMVVADSCYSGTLLRAAPAKMETARERAAWFKRVVKKRGRTALVSGGLEPVTDSGSEGHSVFAGAFLAALRENRDVIDGQTLYQTIKRPVVLNADQTPQYSDIRRAGHDGGDFLFVRR